ncbi:hypothetical protein P9853_10855 [Geobacillus stearothermophilus]|nr:hypothetical protein [Geobacillus stearothermophilus]MED5045392.1 hypothetical protein [Geobacillus stearothermophilus]
MIEPIIEIVPTSQHEQAKETLSELRRQWKKTKKKTKKKRNEAQALSRGKRRCPRLFLHAYSWPFTRIV